jgi:hypothetical protein
MDVGFVKLSTLFLLKHGRQDEYSVLLSLLQLFFDRNNPLQHTVVPFT